MHPLLRYAALLILLFIAPAASLDPGGHWEGKIVIGSRELGITVDLARDADAKWIGSMSVIMSTSIDVPLSDIAVEDTLVRFTATIPGKVSFEGSLVGDAISGTASNREGSAPFQLARKGEAAVKVPPQSTPLPKRFEGTWQTSLEARGKTIRLGLRLAQAANGLATGTLVAIDQGNEEIPVTTVMVKDDELRLESRAVSGTYRGTLGSSGEIAGEWTQGPQTIPLTFRRVPAENK
jgi:hypothetical protein